MAYIMAIDPGKMTGWARLITPNAFSSGEQPLENVLHFIFETLEQGFKPTLICEDFIVTTQTIKKTRQSWSTEGIGVLKFFAREFGVNLTMQTPASAKSFSTNEKLKRLGWWNPGKGHANDAARHLLVYSIKNGLVSINEFRGDHANSGD